MLHQRTKLPAAAWVAAQAFGRTIHFCGIGRPAQPELKSKSCVCMTSLRSVLATRCNAYLVSCCTSDSKDAHTLRYRLNQHHARLFSSAATVISSSNGSHGQASRGIRHPTRIQGYTAVWLSYLESEHSQGPCWLDFWAIHFTIAYHPDCDVNMPDSLLMKPATNRKGAAWPILDSDDTPCSSYTVGRAAS